MTQHLTCVDKHDDSNLILVNASYRILQYLSGAFVAGII